MPTFDITPLGEADLPAVGAYVHAARNLAAEFEDEGGGALTPEFYERTARWRTALNPARPSELELGHAIRREDGTIAGVHLISPFRYRQGERRVLGLASGTYFADADARMQAFFLFKRFLGMKGFDFYFANTCNLYSARVWEKCGGRPGPESEFSWLVPLRVAPLVREVLLRRGWPRLANAGRAAARLIDLVATKRGSGALELASTADLEFLAATADKWRAPELLVPDRDAAYLHWQYVAGQAVAPKDVLRFRDGQGREGWVAVARSRAGIDWKLEVAAMVDWVVPTGFDFATLVNSVARRFAGEADVVTYRKRPDLAGAASLPGRRRAYAAPKTFLIPADRTQQGWESALVAAQVDSV